VRRGAGRAAIASFATRSVNRVSQTLHLGSGTVIGGRVGLAIDPALLVRKSRDRPVALVSGTNGKTTTTALLVAALKTRWPVVLTNGTGANMPAGHVAALVAGPREGPVVLEVDEGYVPAVRTATSPSVILLLNLSRDQLDRMSEVRMLANRWRGALDGAEERVVANADDPLVVWGAILARNVRWVAAGLRWRSDAVGCPSCEGTIVFAEGGQGWSCSCGFSRPSPDAWLADDGSVAHWSDGRQEQVSLSLPGHFNRANAVMATVAAEGFGIAAAAALAAMAPLREVTGRFASTPLRGVPTRLLLAKNPAGWLELLTLVRESEAPAVIGINARIADGRDPSWLWDVPFEVLQGRPVVATGERCLDLSVRLHYAGVDHATEPDQLRAIEAAGSRAKDSATVTIDYIGNYTAFSELVRRR
jgi:UDP-N-acetylmuramyl tripeptide synthase